MGKQLTASVCRIAIVLLAIVFAVAAVRTCLLQGVLLPVRVTGGSMAPALPGRHFEIDCADCGYGFSFGVESPPRDNFAVCPNCGYQANDVSPCRPMTGERVLIDRATWRARGPRRWQMVAIRRSGGEPHLAVKRIVGLPGERMAIRGGEIYANGRPVRKSLADFRQVAVLVHDHQYRPRLNTGLPSRWAPTRVDSGWLASAAGHLEYRPPDAADRSPPGIRSSREQLDWLTYHHWPGLPPPSRRVGESPVRDNYGYNQSLSRSLNKVDDLMLQVRMTMRGAGRVGFRGGAESHRWKVWLEAGGQLGTLPGGGPVPAGISRLTLRAGRSQLHAADTSAIDWQTPRRLELATIDGRLVVAVDGQIVLACDLPPAGPKPRDIPAEGPPLAIGAADAEVSLSCLRIYRDLYYLHPYGTATAWSMDGPLGADEIFVVGDNCPVSRDSRNWPREGVKLRDVLGDVRRWR